ncbi:NAD(P)-dependent oxidoreductase [Paraburkholderia domus]|uniref:NAD(P)-dependent oxidoreductase n=1 Tax=Paraburkholderia domus TaxID=2793075 RepID=UPI001B8CEBB7|nr:NAD(P)H-binding protein [Paraburkholderia domus]
MMRIALFGATGRVGSRVLAEALTRNHEIIAISHGQKNTEQRDRVCVIMGDILDPHSIELCARGTDAAVCAYGPGQDTMTRDLQETLPRSARALVAGLPRAGVRRLVVVGGAGSLEVAPGVQLVDTKAFGSGFSAKQHPVPTSALVGNGLAAQHMIR